MNNIIENKYFSDWNLLIQDLEKNRTESKIYRGQSNYFDPHTEDFYGWQIESSFFRQYGVNRYNFKTFINQQLKSELFTKAYNNYSYKEIELLLQAGQLERIYFLQHYGIPTCFIDFTKNPLIACYFSITSVKGDNSGIEDSDGNLIIYPKKCYVTIYEIDYEVLLNLGIQTIQDKDFPKNYDKYNIENNYLGLDLNPIDNCVNFENNYNLNNQESCFLLYDNYGNGMNLESFLRRLCRRKYKDSDRKIITAYNLEYNGIFKRLNYNNNKTTLFRYLNNEKYSGKYLFNDIQGLKYDFNYFHH